MDDRRTQGGKVAGPSTSASREATALIACGALAREVLALRDRYRWDADVLGVAVLLHNRPERIAPAVRRRIHEARSHYRRIIVVYGECGTRGELDAVLAEEGVERVAGPHCYEMYADGAFGEIMRQAPGTYFLTDYLVRSFDHLVIENLGLDRRPELRQDYFGNYTRVVYLAQTDDPELVSKARRAAEALELPLEIRHVGLGGLEARLAEMMAR
ncbi:MAG TPA: DUF1638 domain-containing protein [Anaerolineales bacterium]|nr:DUF1638 domain-containing protein [Anaerolineales bacterium]